MKRSTPLNRRAQLCRGSIAAAHVIALAHMLADVLGIDEQAAKALGKAALSEGPDVRVGDPMFGLANAIALCEAAGLPS